MSRLALAASILLLAPSAVFGAAERTPVSDATPPPAVDFRALDMIEDGGFEDGTPNSFWNEASTNFGTPICDEPGCGLGTGTGPNSGAFWTWFGGITAPEIGSVSQDVEISNGTAILDFFLEIPAASGNGVDFMEILVDGTQVYEVFENEPGFLTYAQVMVDISAFADGGMHTLEFRSEITGAPSGTNFFVDDINLTVTAGPGPDDGPPVIEVPTLGQVGGAALLVLLLASGIVFLRRRG